MFIASFPRFGSQLTKLGLEEPGNIAKDTLVPYVPIDTAVISEINNCTCVLLKVPIGDRDILLYMPINTPIDFEDLHQCQYSCGESPVGSKVARLNV